MNKYNCYNNMQTSRFAAIKYAQQMANNNLLILFNAATNGGWGVLTSMATDGLLPDEDTALKVSRLTGSSTILEVQPGVAITPDGEVAVNPRVTQVDMSTVAEAGVYNLYIKHAIEYKMTGEETFYSGHTSSTIGTIEEDSCEFELSLTTVLNGVLLAKILYQDGVNIVADTIAASAEIGTGTAVAYPSDTTIAWSPITAITSLSYLGDLPYVRVDKEYLERTAPNTWTRGCFSTNAGVYYEDTVYPMTWSPIVDMRQTNAYRLNIQIGALDRLNKGIILSNSGSYRHIELVAKKAAPETPVVNTTDSEIIWLNSHLAAGYLTADMVAAYEEIQGIQESINNALSLINQLRTDYSEATGDTNEQTRLENEIKKQQMSLLDYRTRAANLKAILATQTMDTLRNIDMRSFAYAIYITEATHTDDMDEPIMYEAEVDYSIVDAPSANTTLSTVRWHYSRRRNIDDIDWRTMERTYEATEPRSMEYVGYNVIYIPIRFGERIRYRVRAIGESGRVSEYTNYISYSFTGYSASQQYIMVSNIYNVLYPDPYQEGIITQELVNLLYAVIDEFRDKSNRITAIESQIQTLISEV